MIGYFLDGPRRRGTMGLPKGPVPYWQVYDVPEMKLEPSKFDADALPETSVKIVTYRRFTIIGDRAYYTVEPRDDDAWKHLGDLICEDIAQDKRLEEARSYAKDDPVHP